MVWVTGIRFKAAGKIYYFECGEWEIKAGDAVIVETARGVEYGYAAVGKKEVGDSSVVQPLKKVIRLATKADQKRYEDNKSREKDALRICKQKIRERGLDMSLVDVEYTFDVGKIIFYFTSDNRVDFRELVKDLAAVFKTRIELRQIGVRDEAKMLGEIGGCGQELCCRRFLGEFVPVSIRMAKEQNLSLNPTKISGVCSRLMCCLRYESELYSHPKKEGKKDEDNAGRNNGPAAGNDPGDGRPAGACRCPGAAAEPGGASGSGGKKRRRPRRIERDG
jgi:cell fate regulator YaaT (PSP1 superfamily)